MEIKTENSGNAKLQLNEQIDDYILSLHNISDNSKEQYSASSQLIQKMLTVYKNYTLKTRGKFDPCDCSPEQ